MKQVIVCAAIRHKDGLIIAGARHMDSIMRPLVEKLDLGYTDWEQGFIDQKGTFIDRTTAWTIAFKANQIRRATGFEFDYIEPQNPNLKEQGYLFSENLY